MTEQDWDDDEPIGVKTNFSKQELIDELFRLQAENAQLRALLARWLRCYQLDEGSPLLHAETKDVLGKEGRA